MAYYCVDYINGDDSTGNGTPAAPFKSITALENFINSGTGFIFGDEVRIADNTTTTLIGTGVTIASGSGNRLTNITTTANYTSEINIFSTLEFEGSISGLIPIPYRASAVSATTITFPASDSGDNFNGTQLAELENVNIYRINNAVNLAVTASTSTLDTFVNKNYAFNPDVESVIISGGWTPGDFTTKTLKGVTTFGWSNLSTFQTTSRVINGRIFSIANSPAGFVFKDFAAPNLRLLLMTGSGAPQFKKLENIRYGYTVPFIGLTSSSIPYTRIITGCHFSNLSAVSIASGFANNSTTYLYENITFYAGNSASNLLNAFGMIKPMVPTGNGMNFVITRDCTIRSSYTRARLNLSLFLSGILPENWDTITLVSLNNAKFGLFTGFGSWQPRVIYPNRTTAPYIPSLTYTIPNAWVGLFGQFANEGNETGVAPYKIIYPGDPLTADGGAFGRIDANNTASSTIRWRGVSQGGLEVVDSTGLTPNMYPCGHGYFTYNTVDQFSGDNCLEFRSWSGVTNGLYGPGLQIVYLEPGQSVTFTAKCKIKTGSSLSSLDVNIRSIVTNQATLAAIGNLSVSANPNNTQVQQSNFSSPVTINNLTWTDVTTTITNNQVNIDNNLVQPLPFIIGLNFNFNTNTTTSVLIDSYEYTIL